MEKIFFVLIFALFFCVFASAASISAPNALPSNVNWSFSAQLDSTDSFEKSTLSLDGKDVLSVYSNGQIVKDPFNGQFALAAFTVDSDISSNNGLVLYVSIIGLEPATHSIKLDTFQSGSLKDSQSASINFFVPLSDGFRQEFDATIRSLTSVTDNLKQKNDSYEASIQSAADSINEFRSSIDSDKQNFSSLDQRFADFVSETNQKLSTAQDEITSLKPKPVEVPVEDVDGGLEGEAVLGEETPAPAQQNLLSTLPVSASTAFASLSRAPWLHIFLALVAVGLIVVFVLTRRKNSGGGGNNYVDDKLFQDAPGLAGDADSGGKWSIK